MVLVCCVSDFLDIQGMNMDRQLLDKYLDNKCDPDELRIIEEWLDQTVVREWTTKEEVSIEEKLSQLKNSISGQIKK